MTSLRSAAQPSRVQQALRAAFRSKLMHRLTYPHGPNRFIELFDPTAVSDETIGVIRAIEHPTSRSVRIRVQPNAQWQGFKAGQYVELAVEINGRRHKRLFSPAQSQHATGELEFTMAVNPDGRLTRHLQSAAQVGDRVILGVPAGDFHLPASRPTRIVLISAGSGITPVLSMLRTLVDERFSGTVDFIHYSRSRADALYAPLLAELGQALPHLNVHCIHTRAGGAHFHAEQLEQIAPDYAQAETFVCGPKPLLDATTALFESQGLASQLYQETFAPVFSAPSDAVDGDVRFQRSERQQANNGQTLLEQAEAAGLAPEYGCRMGVCFACTCKKTAGRVRDLRTGEISDDGEQEIQICVSTPVGSVALDI